MLRCTTVLSAAMIAVFALNGCDKSDPEPGPPVGLLDDDGLFPYPSVHLMTADESTATGYRLNIADDLLPMAAEGTPLEVARVNRLDGFSVANNAVVLLPDADIDSTCLPESAHLEQSLEATSSVQMFDLTAGIRIPCFAELDAHPDCTGPENRTLLIRPMQAVGFGHHVAIALTKNLVDHSGTTVPTPERFAALRDQGEVHPGLLERVDHYEALFTDLEAQGLARADLVLAWDYWASSEAVTHAHLDQIISTTRTALPADPASTPTYAVDWFDDTDNGANLNDHVWRLAEGSFELPSYLNTEGVFTLDEDVNPVQQGTDDAYFMAMVPASLHDAEAGSAPVIVFGHGIFSAPEDYIGENDDPNSVLALADRLGAVVVGSTWRGLTKSDFVCAAEVAVDFGRFPLITDKMIQGVANTLAVPRLLRTQFTEDPIFQATGGGSLIDTERVYYFGISLGGIEGATLMANAGEEEALDYGVLHVGGSTWATMMSRSSDFGTLETLMLYDLPDPVERQVLFAASQLLWDPVDPITHTDGMAGKSLLWQESLGDEQVPNLTTEALARTLAVPLIVPAPESPYGLEEGHAPLGPAASALMQYDPQLGRAADMNRPAEVTGAHTFIRHTTEVHDQIEAFFMDGEEGTIIHPCGDVPCIFDPEDGP